MDSSVFRDVLESIRDHVDGTMAVSLIALDGIAIESINADSVPLVIHSYAGSQPAAAPPPPPAPAPPPTAAEKAATVKAEEDAAEAGLHIITSPIVGTFYRSANPEAEAFVNLGDRIAKGQVLC